METRAYFFGNMYLSSIQQGIQAGHAIAELFVHYRPGDCEEADLLYHWAENDKTMILLNAGYSEELHDLVQFFGDSECNLPSRGFHESPEALDGILTTVAVIIPKYIYEASRQLREREVELHLMRDYGYVVYDERGKSVKHDLTKWEFDLAIRLTQYGLAR